jgi:hypothetical protein
MITPACPNDATVLLVGAAFAAIMAMPSPSTGIINIVFMASVPIQKFLSSLSVNVERALAEALDGRQNIVADLVQRRGFGFLLCCEMKASMAAISCLTDL